MRRTGLALTLSFLAPLLGVAFVGADDAPKPAPVVPPTVPPTVPPMDAPSKPAADAPKPDAPKPDAPKPDAPKPDAPRPDATKPDAPKPDATKDEPKPSPSAIAWVHDYDEAKTKAAEQKKGLFVYLTPTWFT